MNRLAVALLIGACALVPRLGAAQEAGGSPETSAVEMADTKAEHEALAAQYQQKAADARAEAKRHDAMSRAYAGGVRSGGGSQPFATHCKGIAEKQEAIAAEYDMLAKMHADEAKKAR
jgi:hypothetical protein